MTLSMDRETFIVIAGGRRTPSPASVAVEGDTDLGHRLLDTLRRRPPHEHHAETDTWSLADMPDQSGRTVVVTGATLGGLGHYTALELARRGGRVVLAGRTAGQARRDRGGDPAEVPGAELEQLVVDLADLASVRRAAADAAALGPIDVLVNNAGVMAPPYSRTARRPRAADGHQPLRAVPADRAAAPPARRERGRPRGRGVVPDAPGRPAAPPGRPARPEQGRYSRWRVYAQTKLANLLFTYELDRRCREAGLPVKALAAHPGFAGTHLAANGRTAGLRRHGLDPRRRHQGGRAVGHVGALPTLMAATAELPGSTYCGPSGFQEYAGSPSSSAATGSPATRRRSVSCGS